jgi:hypothetical protein
MVYSHIRQRSDGRRFPFLGGNDAVLCLKKENKPEDSGMVLAVYGSYSVVLCCISGLAHYLQRYLFHPGLVRNDS